MSAPVACEHTPAVLIMAKGDLMVFGCGKCKGLFWLRERDYARMRRPALDVEAAYPLPPWRKDGRCNGITQRGERCRIPALEGGAFCATHQTQADPWEELAKRIG